MMCMEKHSIIEVLDEDSRQGICSICGPVKIKIRHRNHHNIRSKWACTKPAKEYYRQNKDKYWSESNWPNSYSYKDKPLICERCGFKAKAYSQIDCHHKDHNHKNNDPDNLEWICANCHRLEHMPCD